MSIVIWAERLQSTEASIKQHIVIIRMT